MNIFKISKNISLNIFSFFGFFNVICQIFFITQIVKNFRILQYDASAISGITLLTGFNITIAASILVIFIVATLIERMLNKNADYKFNDEYENNKFAIIYFYSGILGNILPFIISIIVFNLL